MAENYSQFSEKIGDVSAEEAAWVKKFLCPLDDWEPEEIDPTDADYESKRRADWETFHAAEDMANPERWPEFQWCVTNDEEGLSIWLYAEEGFSLDDVIHFVRHFHEKFRPNGLFDLTWADWCSKPRFGEFGGGALVIHGGTAMVRNTYAESARLVIRLTNPWEDNEVQFARLLCELAQLGLPDETTLAKLCTSMDLSEDALHTLLDRASEVWEVAVRLHNGP